jgi:tetratricopeptide (TPR) repeat protein
MKKLTYTLIALLMAVATGFADDNTEYMQNVQWGEDAIADNRWEEAITYFTQAMRSEPSNPQNIMLLSNIGMLHHYAGEDSLALHTLSEARAMAPGSVVILNNRARVLTSMGRSDDAIADYNMIISMDSTYAQAYYDRAALYLQRGAMTNAETDAKTFIALKPNDNQGKLLMAVIYSNTNRPAEALPLYNELIKAKEDAVYYSARAMCNLVLDDLAAASDDITRGLELDANDPELYYCRAYLNHLRYRDEDAQADLKRAVELGLSPARANALMAPVGKSTGKSKK